MTNESRIQQLEAQLERLRRRQRCTVLLASCAVAAVFTAGATWQPRSHAGRGLVARVADLQEQIYRIDADLIRIKEGVAEARSDIRKLRTVVNDLTGQRQSGK